MLSQGVGYAATAMGFVAAAGGKAVLVRDIAAACDIPAPYLAKIVNGLAKAGLVTTQRGVGGGVTLARDARSISIYDICIALSDPIVEQRCVLGMAECSDERACPAHTFACRQREDQLRFLTTTSISDIAVFEQHRRWQVEHGQALPRTAPLLQTETINGKPKSGKMA
jgi:Rrf2 family protein